MPNQPLLAYNVWLALPSDTRVKLTALFGIPRTGEVIVRSGGMINGNIAGEVTQDGHSAKDLYAISTEKMQTILSTDDTDFYKMFNHIVENIDYLTPGYSTANFEVGEKLKTDKATSFEITSVGGEVVKVRALTDEEIAERAKFATLMTNAPKKRPGRPAKHAKTQE